MLGACLIGSTGNPPARVLSACTILCSGEPATVVRLVVSIVVDTVDLVFTVRSLAHVCQEILERAPTVAYRNASTAVGAEAAIAGAATSTVHRTPGFIGEGFRPTMLVARSTITDIFRQLCSYGVGVMCAFHGMISSRIMARPVLTDSVASLIYGGVVATAARAQLRNQIAYHVESIALGWTPYERLWLQFLKQAA